MILRLAFFVAALWHSAAGFAALQARFDAAWRGNASAVIVNASRGAFNPTAACPSPTLHLFLVGHFRTMWFAAPGFKTFPRADACHFVTVVAPPGAEVDAFDGNGDAASLRKYDGAAKRWAALSWNATDAGRDVPALLGDLQEAFDGRLAYVVAERRGLIARSGKCFLFYWAACYMALEWALGGVAVDPAAVVVRTRPEMDFRWYFGSLERFRWYGASGTPRSRHLILGQELKHPRLQSDYFLVTTAGVYATDVARPCERAFAFDSHFRDETLVAMCWANGWGWGLSMGLGAARLRDGRPCCACPGGGDDCDRPSCFATVVFGAAKG